MATCDICYVSLTSIQNEQKHLESQWHLHNVRRKDAGMETVSEDVFLQQQAACGKASTTHLKSDSAGTKRIIGLNSL